MKVPCKFCGSKFHPKGVYNHQAKCPGRDLNIKSAEMPPLVTQQIGTATDVIRNQERAYRRGMLRAMRLILDSLNYED